MLRKIFKSYDYPLILVTIILSVFGLIMVYSASSIIAVNIYHYPSEYFYEKQWINLLIALCAFIFTSLLPYKLLKNKKFVLMIVFISIIGLFVTFLFGKVAGNAQSWLELGFRRIQPSEFTKIAVIIYLCL